MTAPNDGFEMAKVEDSDELPNGDEATFVSEDNHPENGGESDGGEDAMHVSETVTLPANVFMATSHGLLTPVTAEQLQEAGIKTTHIVIHDETSDLAEALKTPTTPLPPPTPSTPLSRERGFKYQWDETAYDSILPVRCKNSSGEFHKTRFGSGGRGRCIKMEDSWYTPSEFEAVCGRASSKDWKRSIRYGGRTLSCLIEDGILQPHATSCTCAACCDDDSVTGPIRLFMPYKRRKRDSGEHVIRKKSLSMSTKSLSQTSLKNDLVPLTSSSVLGTTMMSLNTSPAMRVSTSDAPEIQILTAADNNSSILTEGSMLIAPPTPKSTSSSPSMSGQKIWWQLEEMANNLIAQAEQLKTLIESAKHQSQITCESSILQYKQQLEREKNESLQTMRIEVQMQMQRAIMEERAQKDIAVQQALAQARAGIQEKMDTLSTITATATPASTPGDHKGDAITVTDDKNTVVYLWPTQTTPDIMEPGPEGVVEPDLDKTDKD